MTPNSAKTYFFLQVCVPTTRNECHTEHEQVFFYHYQLRAKQLISKVENFTKRKIHIPLFMVSKKLSVFNPTYLWSCRIKWAEKKFGHLSQKVISQNVIIALWFVS